MAASTSSKHSKLQNNSQVQSHQQQPDTSRFGVGSDFIQISNHAAQNKKFFIQGVNSLLGHSLFEELRNDHISIHTGEASHKFFGTLNLRDEGSVPVPSPSIKVLDNRFKPRNFKKQILNCDVVVIDLSNENDLDEAHYIIQLLKGAGEKNQTLVVVTPCFTWMNTPKKMKKAILKKQKELEDSDAEDGKSKQLREDESESEEPNGDKELYFLDKDYQSRVPPPKYQHLKGLEMVALSAQKQNSKLRVHILCSGLQYGNGEQNRVFYEFFRRAWLSLHPELAALPILGAGTNRIPTVHILDLARSIKHLIYNKVTQQYLIAVDKATKQTQARVMKAISEGMGSGLTKEVELEDIIEEEWAEYVMIDLKLKVSDVLDKANFWHCKDGISPKTMGLLNTEFNTFRGLFPLKVFVTGPPGSGKTFYSEKLKEAYGVPVLRIAEVVQKGLELQDELGDELRQKVEEIKDQMIEDYNKTKKKKDPELDRNAIKVRLPDEYIVKLMLLQMNSAACRNKGFILDGYPRNQNDAKNIFLKAIEGYQHPENYEPDPKVPFPGFTIKSELIPQYCIVFTGEDAALKLRLKELPPEQLEGTHWNDQGMDRRLKVYREQNPTDSGHCVQDFFLSLIGPKSAKILPFDRPVEEQTRDLQTFIEQNGKPCCLNLITEADKKFLRQLEKKNRKKGQVEKEEEEKKEEGENEAQEEEEEEEDELVKQIRQQELNEEQRKLEEQLRKEEERQEAEQRKIREEQEAKKLEQIRQQERDLLDTRSQPIRQYLMDNVIPHLTEGLIDLCKKTPGDPVEYLSDFLLQRADLIDQQRIQQREEEIRAKMEAKAKKLADN